MSTPSPFLSAAAPELIIALKALQTFLTNLGTDPTKLALTFPGAAQVLLGTLQLQVPALASAEIGAVQTELNSKISALITKLQPPTT
jgi:hypothetical protein